MFQYLWYFIFNFFIRAFLLMNSHYHNSLKGVLMTSQRKYSTTANHVNARIQINKTLEWMLDF